MVRVSFTLSAALANGGTAQFKLADLPAPLLEVTGLAYNSAKACATRLQTDGIVLVRNISGSSIAASTAMSTSFTYLTA